MIEPEGLAEAGHSSETERSTEVREAADTEK
jgi:hypothetical protein